MTKDIGSINDWDKISEKYDDVTWVKDRRILESIKTSLALTNVEDVLEVGIGTGVVSNFICNNVKSITGIDTSTKMLNADHIHPKIIKMQMDALEMKFPDNSFHRIIYRSVLHHFDNKLRDALREAKRVLRVGGLILIAEGVPMDGMCVFDFANILFEKEPNRLIVTPQGLLTDLMATGFNNFMQQDIYLENQSIKNWIDSTVFDEDQKKRILQAHLDTSDHYKKVANMQVFPDGDITVSMRWHIIIGEKTYHGRKINA